MNPNQVWPKDILNYYKMAPSDMKKTPKEIMSKKAKLLQNNHHRALHRTIHALPNARNAVIKMFRSASSVISWRNKNSLWNNPHYKAQTQPICKWADREPCKIISIQTLMKPNRICYPWQTKKCKRWEKMTRKVKNVLPSSLKLAVNSPMIMRSTMIPKVMFSTVQMRNLNWLN